MLAPREKRPRPETVWLAVVANAWILKKRSGEAAVTMERAARISDKPVHWHRASPFWLYAENSEKAAPLLQQT